MQSLLFVINPISGTNRKETIVKAIDRYIDKTRFTYAVRYTEYAGHAAVLTREAVACGTDIVVAVGGDGTINEVARCLTHSQTALGIIPCGSGNGLARHLRIPLTPVAAVKVINKACIMHLDYGRINELPFFCTCGVGFDAFVSLRFAQAGKRGLMTYAEKTLIDGLSYKPETYRLTIDDGRGGSKQCEAFLIACANASQYGNNVFIAPHASMKDGLMDITILKPFSLIEAPIILGQLFNKTLSNNSNVQTFRAQRLVIERHAAGAAHCDGDPVELPERIVVELIAGALPVVVNENYKVKSSLLEEGDNYLQHLLEPLQNSKIAQLGIKQSNALKQQLNDGINKLLGKDSEYKD